MELIEKLLARGVDVINVRVDFLANAVDGLDLDGDDVAKALASGEERAAVKSETWKKILDAKKSVQNGRPKNMDASPDVRKVPKAKK
jgi:hypothetical protein